MRAKLPFSACQSLWLVLFGLNLLAPLAFGFQETRDAGRAGMAAALVVFWFAGHWACGRSKISAFVVLAGAASAAIFQVPLAIAAGLIALRVAGPVESEFDGFLVTMLTGVQLFIAMIVAGFFILGCKRFFDPHPAHGGGR
jgi:hypothetical protein